MHPLAQLFPEIKNNVELAQFTTIKIGGPADFYYELKDINELQPLIEIAEREKTPWIVIGGGSNIVFSERGFRGLIIHLKAKTIELFGNIVTADAGVLLSQLIQFAQKNGLKGIENLAGLPGTLGGAIRGNAGANGTEIKDIVSQVTVADPEKGILILEQKDLKFSYRNSILKKNRKQIVLKATLKLDKASPDDLASMQETIKKNLVGRTGRQPQGKTTGSFFKNPSPQNPAGKLLDEAGCKGLTVGKAQISELHANWIINLNGATQGDVIKLAKMAQNKVKHHSKIDLIPEVQLIGETGFIDI